MEALLAIILLIIIFVIGIFYSTLTWGLVMYKFYHWFILPVFTTLPEINFLQAIGLILFISLFKYQRIYNIKDEYVKETPMTQMWIATLSPWLFLIIGWIIYNVIY